MDPASRKKMMIELYSLMVSIDPSIESRKETFTQKIKTWEASIFLKSKGDKKMYMEMAEATRAKYLNKKKPVISPPPQVIIISLHDVTTLMNQIRDRLNKVKDIMIVLTTTNHDNEFTTKKKKLKDVFTFFSQRSTLTQAERNHVFPTIVPFLESIEAFVGPRQKEMCMRLTLLWEDVVELDKIPFGILQRDVELNSVSESKKKKMNILSYYIGGKKAVIHHT